jgi:hypothetical protein
MPAKQNSSQSSQLQYSVKTGPRAINPLTTNVTTLPAGTITIGAGVPDNQQIQAAGSIYLRSDGVSGTFIYRSNGTAWVPIL